MAFTKQAPFTKKVTDLPDKPSPTYTATDIKAHFQTPSDELMVTVNNAIDKLNATTDGVSGADNVGATGFDGLASNVQVLLDYLKANKTDLTGNHQGTWQGYSPTQTDPGIQSVVDDHTAQLAESTNDYSYTLGFLNGLNDIRTRAILKVNGFYSIDDGTEGKYRVLAVDGTETWTDIKDTNLVTLFQTSSIGEIRATGGTKKLKVMPKQGKYNVKLFGAKGDSIQDDTICLQRAIAYGQTLVRDRFLDGVEIFHPKGTYLVSDTLTVTSSNICLSGNSISDSILYAPSSNFDIVHFDGSALALYGSSMKNLRIYTPTNATAGRHLKVTKTINSIFENLYLVGWYDGIVVDGCGKTYFDKIILSQENRTAGASNYGLDFLTTNGINSDIHFNDVQIVPDLAKSSIYTMSVRSADGIYFNNFHIHGGILIQPDNIGNGQTLASLFFSNCYFDRSNDANFTFTGSANAYRNFKFINCYFRDAVKGIIFNTTSAVSRVKFTNCDFTQQENSAVDCLNTQASEVKFVGCDFADNNTANLATAGDMLLQGTDFIIDACTFKNGGSLGYGVNFKSGLSNSIISACNFTGSTAATKFVNSGSQNKIGTLNGVVAKNRGSATVLSGATSVTVTHGVGVSLTLENIMFMARSLKSGGGDVYPANLTATTFDIVMQNAPTANVTFTWWVDATT
jgi:hypothetical protein